MNRVFNVIGQDLKNSLVYRGFEVIGTFGDNVNMPINYSMRGDVNRLEQRQKIGIAWSKWLQKSIQDRCKGGHLVNKGKNALGGRYEN